MMQAFFDQNKKLVFLIPSGEPSLNCLQGRKEELLKTEYRLPSFDIISFEKCRTSKHAKATSKA